MPTASNEYLLAFDFSLDHLDVALQAPDGEWLIHHERYLNNLPGYLALKQDLLSYLSQQTEVQLTAVGESSGLLWWHAFRQITTDLDLAPFTPRLALLNPKHVKHYRKALPEEDKCDPKDPQLVARYYQTAGVRHFYRFDERYLPLRQLTRAYCRLIHTLAAEKAFWLSLVYLTASEYIRLKPFSDTFGVTSTHILTQYPDIAAIADIPVQELAAQLDHLARGHLKDSQESARKLHQVARDSYPLPKFLMPTLHTVLQTTLEHIRFLEGQQATYQTLIENELSRLPEAELALQEKGLGPILVGGCLAEIQDTRRFTTGYKYDARRKRMRPRTYRDGQASVARMAGLWWPRNASGRFEGQDRHLARERNPYLRYWFVQAAYCLKRHRADYAAYYRRKYDEALHHPHQRGLILTARKAVRLIFALLHKGQMARREEVSMPA